jgi:uncharacterized membrane protein
MELVRLLRNQWDRTTAFVAIVAGLVVLTAGWVGASGTRKVADQIPYIISGAVFGLFLLGIGATLWLSADLRDEWRSLQEIRAEHRSGEGT